MKPEERFSIEQIVYTNYVRYDVLTNLINAQYGNGDLYKDVSHINLYIDLYSIVRRLYGDNYTLSNPYTLASCIINMCGHYRSFFRTRYSTDTTIFIVDSNNCSDLNRRFYQGYNQGYAESVILNKKVTEMIYTNRSILSEICQYLNDVQYISTNFETGVMIDHIITKNREAGNTYPNMIITKDIYLYQLVSPINKGDIVVLRPKKYRGEDSSYIINSNNVMYIYMKERSVNEDIAVLACNMNSELLSFIMSITRMPERSVKSIVSIPKIVKLLSKLLSENIILNQRNTDIDRLSNLLFQEEENQIPGVTIDFRFKAIDIPFQYSVFVNSPEYLTYKGVITNLYDPDALSEINNKYFANVPIILENL